MLSTHFSMSLMTRQFTAIFWMNISSQKKVFKMIKTLYKQRKSSLLWLCTLIVKCLKLELKSISDESCLFTDANDILMFFYVNDVIFAFKIDREKITNELIIRLNTMFVFRNLNEIKHFLEIKIIIQDENDDDRTVHLV
jgi:hypothetical protein